MKVLTLVLLLIGIVACGDNDDDEGIRMDQEESTGKNLFDRWVRSDNRFFLDLTGGSFDQSRNILLALETGEVCNCTILVRGTQRIGTIDIFACSYAGGGSGDPDCDALWENGRRPYEYTKGQTTLEICEAPGICGTFR